MLRNTRCRLAICFRRFSSNDKPTSRLLDLLRQSKLEEGATKSSKEVNVTQLVSHSRSRQDHLRTLKEAREKVLQKQFDEENEGIDKELALAAQKVSDNLEGQHVKRELIDKLVEIEKETFEASKPSSAALDASKPPWGRFEASKMSSEGTLSPSSLVSSLSQLRVQRKDDVQTVEKKKSFDDNAEIETRKFLDEIGFKISQRDRSSSQLPRHHQPLSHTDPKTYDIIEVYNGPGMGIFAEGEKVVEFEAKPPLLPVWNELSKKHLNWLSNISPRNGFEEMIEWTENGKMHPYPMDNEYGMDEKFIAFHEHVFLNRLLASDDRVPKSGPIRDFLELVVNGLSKNAYMPLQRKHEHIEWFKEYFVDRVVEIEKIKENEDSLKRS